MGEMAGNFDDKETDMNPGVVWIQMAIGALGLAVVIGLTTTWIRQQPYAQFLSNSFRAVPFTLTAIFTIGLTFWMMFPQGLNPDAQVYEPLPPLLCDGTGFIGNPQTMLYYPPATDLPLLSPRERCFATSISAETAGYRPARH